MVSENDFTVFLCKRLIAKRAANTRDGMTLPTALRQQLDAFALEMGMPTLQAT